ncbi:MAG: hypothetical protein J7500_05255 [Sphingomonas sp.]|uniref:hypothetical protein n=1 Tax=Sphingomonas sp. TaxID=28214 RepID=UPI001B0232A7|nr:hypothetical protein [Sphingomonas sp.]MBO9622101.1 hypothetical protein [Sphingomonas sp.]
MIERFLEGLGPMMEDPLDTEYLAVILPGDLDPFERHYRYCVTLDAELRLAGLGCSQGGGTMLGAEDAEGERETLFCVVDIDAIDVDGARALLRIHLPELGCPPATLIQYGDHEDRWDGERWHLGEARTSYEDDPSPSHDDGE